MATKNIASVSEAKSLSTDDSLLCIAGGSVGRISFEHILQELSSEITIPHFTLEKTSSPLFDVNASAALNTYLGEVGGYMMLFKDGKAYAAKLESENWNYFADGTVVDDASKYETMVHLPTFHFKASGKTMNVGGLTPIDGGHTFQSPQWVGAYEMYVDSSGKGHSRPDVSPAHSKTMSTFWNHAQKTHTNCGLANYGFHCLINALFQAKYGNLNCEAVIGKGGEGADYQTWRDVPMGYGRTIGDGSGTAATSLSGYNCVKLFGFEDLWAKLWEFRPGIRFYYDSDSSTRHAVVYDGNIVSNTAEGRDFTIPLLNAGGSYTTKMQLGEHWDMIPIAVGGGSSTYYCDGYYDSQSGELLYVGGYANNGARCGLSYASSSSGFSFSWTYLGARLAFYGRPEIIEGAEIVKM